VKTMGVADAAPAPRERESTEESPRRTRPARRQTLWATHDDRGD
jgi:hypothetical protein